MSQYISRIAMRGLYFPSNGSIFGLLTADVCAFGFIVLDRGLPKGRSVLTGFTNQENTKGYLRTCTLKFQRSSPHRHICGDRVHWRWFSTSFTSTSGRTLSGLRVRRRTLFNERLGSAFQVRSPTVYLSLEREAEICLVQGDGWWEIYPTRADLFSEIQAFTSCREIATRRHGDWMPEFV